MRILIILSLCTLFISITYSEELIQKNYKQTQNSIDEIGKLIRFFISAKYHYSLLSMVMFHSDAAFPGISKLAQSLAEDKNELANICMNYLVLRNALPAPIFALKTEAKFKQGMFDLTNHHIAAQNWNILDYKMKAEYAMHFILHLEKKLYRQITAALPDVDKHAEHFLQHTVLETQFDRLSRIENLYSKMKNQGSNMVYSYEFDRSAIFVYLILILLPPTLHANQRFTVLCILDVLYATNRQKYCTPCICLLIVF